VTGGTDDKVIAKNVRGPAIATGVAAALAEPADR
jgi:hypothetical protein